MVMALADFPPERMRPTALILNLFVASLTLVNFARTKNVKPKACLPLLLGSLPLAFLGGRYTLHDQLYKTLLAFTLLVAAGRLWMPKKEREEEAGVPVLPGLVVGATIGLLAGLTGTGGGIFLTPWLIFSGWQGARNAAGTSCLFILFNSVAGLVAKPQQLANLPIGLEWLVAGAVAGGLFGSWMGSRRLELAQLRKLLGVVLILAAIKLLIS